MVNSIKITDYITEDLVDLDLKSKNREGIHLFFVFASPNKDSQIYLKVLARISRLIREEEFRENLFNCKTPKEVIDCIREKEEN